MIAFAFIAGISYAEPGFTIPNYYAQSDFLGTSPGVSGDASGAFFNPAVWGMMQTSEIGFYWNDFEFEEGTEAPKTWSLQFGAPGMGFTMHDWTYRMYDNFGGYDEYSFTDYNIGIGFGDRKAAFGLGYTWSKGEIPLDYERANTFSAGFLSRPCRHASVGLAGHYVPDKANWRGIADIGIRPLGNSFLTLFADAALMDYQSLADMEWAAGLSIQPAPGLDLFGKYYRNGYQDGTILAGIALTLGSSKVSYMPHYDKNSKQTYNTYGIRLREKPSEDVLTDIVMKDKLYLKLKFDCGIKYQRYKYFDDCGYTLTEMLEMLDNAKNDPKISGLVLNVTEEMWGSWELIWEVREKLLEVKEAGKKIYVFLERGGMKQYYIASVGDHIMIDPESMLTMTGFNLGRTYYKNLTEKIGVGVDEWRFFEYKSAAESFSRTSMSKADREQRQALVDGWYETYRSDICASRDITEAEFDQLVDNTTIFLADSLLVHNLADTTGRWEEFTDWIKELDGKNKKMMCPKMVEKLQTLDEEWSAPPQIAVIYGLGECSMNSGITANKLKHVIKRARENKNIKAVVFRADSPGGDILPSDLVAVELKKTAEEKPVIVSQGWVAGSGGYWISMYGDKIVASPWTITGSIGVIGTWFYNDGLGEHLGLTYDNTQRGKHADILGGINIPLLGQMPDRNLTTEERDKIEKMVRGMYKAFVQKVADGRGMEFDEVAKIAEGRVYTGTEGKEIGLVDELGGLEKSIAMALEAAGIDPDSRWELIEMPKKGLFDASMFTPKLLGFKGPIYQMLTTDDPEIRYFRMLAQASGSPMVMMDPDIVFGMEDMKR